jgi:hypothetical protein
MDEKLKSAINKEDRWESSEEEEEYDYGQECEEVYYKRTKQSKYFEEINFRRDQKNALVYTDTDYMQKQRGVLTHVLKQLGTNLM